MYPVDVETALSEAINGQCGTDHAMIVEAFRTDDKKEHEHYVRYLLTDPCNLRIDCTCEDEGHWEEDEEEEESCDCYTIDRRHYIDDALTLGTPRIRELIDANSLIRGWSNNLILRPTEGEKSGSQLVGEFWHGLSVAQKEKENAD